MRRVHNAITVKYSKHVLGKYQFLGDERRKKRSIMLVSLN
jgi:hypothetical protein